MAHCHPDKLHWAKGLCANCYIQQQKKNNARKALCHPEQPHYARVYASFAGNVKSGLDA
jgi:hypothetical protein